MRRIETYIAAAMVLTTSITSVQAKGQVKIEDTGMSANKKTLITYVPSYNGEEQIVQDNSFPVSTETVYLQDGNPLEQTGPTPETPDDIRDKLLNNPSTLPILIDASKLIPVIIASESPDRVGTFTLSPRVGETNGEKLFAIMIKEVHPDQSVTSYIYDPTDGEVIPLNLPSDISPDIFVQHGSGLDRFVTGIRRGSDVYILEKDQTTGISTLVKDDPSIITDTIGADGVPPLEFGQVKDNLDATPTNLVAKIPQPVIYEVNSEGDLIIVNVNNMSDTLNQGEVRTTPEGLEFIPIGGSSRWIIRTDIPELDIKNIGLSDMNLRLLGNGSEDEATKIPGLNAKDALNSTDEQIFNFIKSDGTDIPGAIARIRMDGKYLRQIVIDNSHPGEVHYNIYVDLTPFINPRTIQSKLFSQNAVIITDFYAALACRYGGLVPIAKNIGNLDEAVMEKVLSKDEIYSGNWALNDTRSITVDYNTTN